MNVKDALLVVDVSKQSEGVYNFLIEVLTDQKEIFYKGTDEHVVSDEIKESVIVRLVETRDSYRDSLEAHLKKEVVTLEEIEE